MESNKPASGEKKVIEIFTKNSVAPLGNGAFIAFLDGGKIRIHYRDVNDKGAEIEFDGSTSHIKVFEWQADGKVIQFNKESKSDSKLLIFDENGFILVDGKNVSICRREGAI